MARLRAKPGGDAIGDFAMTRVEQTFTVACLVLNTIQNLTTEDEQDASRTSPAASVLFP